MMGYLVFCLFSAGDKSHQVSVRWLLKIFGFTISIFHMVHCVAVGDMVTSYIRFVGSKSVHENSSRVFMILPLQHAQSQATSRGYCLCFARAVNLMCIQLHFLKTLTDTSSIVIGYLNEEASAYF